MPKDEPKTEKEKEVERLRTLYTEVFKEHGKQEQIIEDMKDRRLKALEDDLKRYRKAYKKTRKDYDDTINKLNRMTTAHNEFVEQKNLQQITDQILISTLNTRIHQLEMELKAKKEAI